MQVQLNTRVDVDIASALDKYCRRTGKSKAGVVSAAITEYMKNHPVETGRKENQK